MNVRNASTSPRESPALQSEGQEENFALGGVDGGDTLPFMSQPADTRRRWLGLFCLTVAACLLTWGLIVLPSRLDGVWFVLYWAACFLFTCAAIVIALIDMRAVRRQIRLEQETLLKDTLEDIEREQAKRVAEKSRPDGRA